MPWNIFCASSVIAWSRLLQFTITVVSIRPLGRWVSTGSGSSLNPFSTSHTAARPETPTRKATINTWVEKLKNTSELWMLESTSAVDTINIQKFL